MVKDWESSYAAFLNNPIYFDDPFGNDPPKRIKFLKRIGNWIKGDGYKNKANKYAVKNKVDESQISTGKDGSIKIDESYYTTHGTPTNAKGEFTARSVFHEKYSKFEQKEGIGKWLKNHKLKLELGAKIDANLGAKIKVPVLKDAFELSVVSTTLIESKYNLEMSDKGFDNETESFLLGAGSVVDGKRPEGKVPRGRVKGMKLGAGVVSYQTPSFDVDGDLKAFNIKSQKTVLQSGITKVEFSNNVHGQQVVKETLDLSVSGGIGLTGKIIFKLSLETTIK